MPNADNLTPFGGDNPPPGAGRPKGSPNRSTIARKWLAAEEKAKNPITKVEEKLSQEDIMTLAMIKKARSGDVTAYRALMDSAFGAPKQDITSDDKALAAPIIQIIAPKP